MKEAERSIFAFFVTLTYDNEYVPITENGFMTVKKEHIQLFIRMLRRRNKEKIKYYAAAEYGSRTKRPHYHIIIFNADIETLVGTKEGKMLKNGLLEYDAKTVFRCQDWKYGNITVGKVEPASAAYVLKYISKPTKIPQFQRDDREKEFALMSKKMGANYITEQMVNWHKADLKNRLYIKTKDGIKIPLPRYFREKIYSKHQLQKIYAHIEQKEKQDVENKLKTNYTKYMQELEKENMIAIEKQRKHNRTPKKDTI